MAVIVEYKCRSCGDRKDAWVKAGEAPDTLGCAICGGISARQFGSAFLTGARSSTAGAAGPAPVDPCMSYPDVPGLCHMEPSVARRWAAQVRGDQRAVEREIAYQEKAVKSGELDPSKPFSGHGQAKPVAATSTQGDQARVGGPP